MNWAAKLLFAALEKIRANSVFRASTSCSKILKEKIFSIR